VAAEQLYGGRRSDGPEVDSLANYIERAVNDVRTAEYGLDALPAEGRDDRMMLFLGIARGVVRYLDDHQPAFGIGSGDGGAHDHGGHVGISVDPT
jgi:hypothetical protein